MKKILTFIVLAVAGVAFAQNANQEFAAFDGVSGSRKVETGKLGKPATMPKDITLPSEPSITLNPPPYYSERMRVWQGIPSIEISDGGRLWSTWYSGNICEGAARHYAMLYTSGDDGATWKMVAIFDPAIFFEGSGGDPSLWKSKDGSVYWILNRKLTVEEGATPRSCWFVKIKDPEAEEPKFEKPKFIARALVLNKPETLSNGRVFISMNKMEKCEKRIIFFDANDKAGDVKFASQWGFMEEKDPVISEPMAYQRKNGDIVCLIRSNAGILQIESKDLGKTWGDKKPFALQVSVGTRFFVGRLKSGNLLLVANDHPKARSNMTVFLSEDDGVTWPYKMAIDSREFVSYPDAAEGENGFIYVTYDRGRYKKDMQEILFAKITEEDIKAGKLVNNLSRLEQVISKLAPHGGGVKKDSETPDMHKAHSKKGK